ncbi:hypothetical protein OF83DRAFT_1178884 [Amylostereum chailletii]|nr:hypothetical protein OF83DRAFT_1178884 [Amylostereum chailletii]
MPSHTTNAEEDKKTAFFCVPNPIMFKPKHVNQSTFNVILEEQKTVLLYVSEGSDDSSGTDDRDAFLPVQSPPRALALKTPRTSKKALGATQAFHAAYVQKLSGHDIHRIRDTAFPRDISPDNWRIASSMETQAKNTNQRGRLGSFPDDFLITLDDILHKLLYKSLLFGPMYAQPKHLYGRGILGRELAQVKEHMAPNQRNLDVDVLATIVEGLRQQNYLSICFYDIWHPRGPSLSIPAFKIIIRSTIEGRLTRLRPPSVPPLRLTLWWPTFSTSDLLTLVPHAIDSRYSAIKLEGPSRTGHLEIGEQLPGYPFLPLSYRQIIQDPHGLSI